MKVFLKNVMLFDFYGIKASDYEDDGKFQFKTKVLFDKKSKNHMQQVAVLKKKAHAACLKRFAEKAKKVMGKAKFHAGIRMSAEGSDMSDEKIAYLEDFVFLNAKAQDTKRPGYAVKRGGKLVTLTDDFEIDEHFYSGAIVNVSLTISPFEKGTGGYSFWLNNVLKVKDGERLDGNTTAAQDFDNAEMMEGVEDINDAEFDEFDNEMDEFEVEEEDDGIPY